MDHRSRRRCGHRGPISKLKSILAVCLLILLAPPELEAAGSMETVLSAADTVRCLVHVSVDGLRSDAVIYLGPGNLPNFYRLRVLGAFTENARTDYDFTSTLPNHACQLTGRPVLGLDGHGVSFNDDPGTTLEDVNGFYIAGIYDVIHDNGLTTAMYASKPKFDFFDRSWNGENGSPDLIGDDDGRDKIDTYVNTADTDALVDSFIAHAGHSVHDYSFIHFVDPDDAGHDYGWESAAYYGSIMKVDSLLGRILDVIEGDERFASAAAVLVTADHGGSGTSHLDPAVQENYTIPFYVMAPGVPAGADLYWLNPSNRLDPGAGRPDYSASPQPVRNGEVTNLALDLISLGAIPGSTINGSQDLEVRLSGGSAALPSVELTSPTEGEVFEVPAAIDISVSTGGGMISKVEFFADYSKIWEDSEQPYEYVWADVLPGEHVITARVVGNDGAASAASVHISVTAAAPVRDGIGFNDVIIYPNPFRKSTTVRFSLRTGGTVELLLFDALGRRVGRAVGGAWEAGVYTTILDGSNMSPGCYFYSARLGKVIRTGKLMVLR
jgi:hypothetical protein